MIRTHGMSRSKNPREVATYRCWGAMKERCLNSNTRGYHYYGGRGITVCKRWVNSFESFLEDMGLCPEGKSLDRKNNDKNYSPGNCRWATPSEQNYNKRKFPRPKEKWNKYYSRVITMSREGSTTREIAKVLGLGKSYVHRMVKHEYGAD